MKNRIKLRKLLSKLSAMEKSELIVSPYFDKTISDIANKIKEKNNNKNLNEINLKIGVLINEMRKSNSLTKTEFEAFIIKYELLKFDIKDKTKEISHINEEVKKVVSDFKKEFDKFQKQIEELKANDKLSELTALSEGIATMKIEFLSRLANVSGGNMNRQILVDGVNPLTRYTDINWIAGTGVTLTPVNNDTLKKVNITIDSSGSTGYQAPTSGVVDGSNTVFVFTTTPNVLIIDGVPRQKTQSDGNANWTGTTTVTLSVAPNFDIFSSA